MRNKFIWLLLCCSAGVMTFDACQSEDALTYQRYYVNGKDLYDIHCRNCHGAQGEGLGKLYPALNNLQTASDKLACLIKYGTITANKAGAMPGNNNLPDIDIAQLVVYITNSFGNNRAFFSDSEVRTALNKCK